MLMGAVLSILLSASSAAEIDIESQISSAIDQLESDWRTGNFHAIAEAATRTLELIEASSCPWREDAVIVSFIGGVTGESHSHIAESGYMYWVAMQVNEARDVLPASLVRVAEARTSLPGEDISLDGLFIQSAYRNTVPGDRCAEPQLETDILYAEPEAADHLFIALGFTPRRFRAETVPDEVLYAYPGREGSLIAAAIIVANDWRSTQRDIATLVLDPCTVYPGKDLGRIEVCRETPHAETEQ